MIKPEDLRTGDLVRVSRDCAFPKGTMCVVSDINPLKVFNDKKGVVSLSAINDDDDGPWGVWCCNVEGIPVTPEILNKNDFKEEAVGEYHQIRERVQQQDVCPCRPYAPSYSHYLHPRRTSARHLRRRLPKRRSLA